MQCTHALQGVMNTIPHSSGVHGGHRKSSVTILYNYNVHDNNNNNSTTMYTVILVTTEHPMTSLLIHFYGFWFKSIIITDIKVFPKVGTGTQMRW